MQDKFSAVWVSHSSITDFLHCPRAYFLKNMYKDPSTHHKIQIMAPSLALGQAVHEVVESLSVLPTAERFRTPLTEKLSTAWEKITGKRGGFQSPQHEQSYKERGLAMIRRVMEHPGPVARQAVKLKEELPQFWLSEDENIILCGKIDWLEYLPESDSIKILDFKTSRREEEVQSLQLPIYTLLAHHCQKRPVAGISYWYLELSDAQTERPMPDIVEAEREVLRIAKQIKLARQLERLKCPEGDGGCRYCQPFERILRGEAEKVGEDQHRRDIYILATSLPDTDESVVL